MLTKIKCHCDKQDPSEKEDRVYLQTGVVSVFKSLEVHLEMIVPARVLALTLFLLVV